MNLTSLTKKLISIPSYVDKENYELQISNYLYRYIKNNLKWLKVYKQKVENSRNNIIAINTSNPKLIFISHMDTVKPSGDRDKMLIPQIKGNKLFGLGAVDMKGGLATVMGFPERRDNFPYLHILNFSDPLKYVPDLLLFDRQFLLIGQVLVLAPTTDFVIPALGNNP